MEGVVTEEHQGLLVSLMEKILSFMQQIASPKCEHKNNLSFRQQIASPKCEYKKIYLLGKR